MRSPRIHLRVLCFSLLTAWACPSVAAAAVPVSVLAQPQLEGRLNPNSATAAQWELLPAIGPTTAGRIVEYVKKYPIRQLTQLMRVKGIGRKTYDKIRPYLILEGETTLRVADAPG
jgi:competence protein ComEA